jgi:hypothetical protein
MITLHPEERPKLSDRMGFKYQDWGKPLRYIIVLLFGFLASSGCTIFDLPNQSGMLLFQDDFSSPNSGWNRYRGDKYLSDYHDGMYHIAVFEKNIEAWALPGFNFTDVIIEVAVTSLDGPQDNVYGTLCRYSDTENFYFFVISSDGYSGIGLSYMGNREILTGESMLPSEAIQKGSATNLIQAECVGNQLSLSVNGTVVNQVQSDKLKNGDVGLIAGSYEDEGTEIFFDNFVVKNPY